LERCKCTRRQFFAISISASRSRTFCSRLWPRWVCSVSVLRYAHVGGEQSLSSLFSLPATLPTLAQQLTSYVASAHSVILIQSPFLYLHYWWDIHPVKMRFIYRVAQKSKPLSRIIIKSY